MRRILIYGLNLQYNGFAIDILGWQVQLILLKLKGLLVGQETLMKQMTSVSIKSRTNNQFCNAPILKVRGRYVNVHTKRGDTLTYVC